MTAALRKCFAMRDPEVISCIANMGTMRHKDLDRLLSVLHMAAMQQLILETPFALQRVSKHLQSERVWCLYHMQGFNLSSCWHTRTVFIVLW